MSRAVHLAAVDLGASSGRVYLCAHDGERIELTEAHRFAHTARHAGGRLRWDAEQIFEQILAGLGRAGEAAPGEVEGIGVSGWGVDYGLLGADGSLLADPVHYRDSRTAGVVARAHRTLGAEQLFARTGVASWSINTLYQLLSEPEQAERAERLLFVPDLFQHRLSGSGASERSVASTSQMLGVDSREWDGEILDAFGIRRELMPPLLAAGTDLGPLLPAVRGRVGLPRARVVMPAAHDSASAALGVPRLAGERAAWVSSGTWNIVGLDAEGPVTSALALGAQLSNEPSPAGGVSLTRNVMGMWLLQECRRHWFPDGAVSERELVERAAASEAAAPLLDPDDPLLAPPGEMPARIRELARLAGGRLESEAALVRCILESVAAKTCWSLERCAEAAGTEFDVVHVVGGGGRIELLNRLLADFSGRPVVAGPSEAAVLGGAAVQLLGLGRLADWEELREVVRASAATSVFEPSAAAPAQQGRLAAVSEAWGIPPAATAASTPTEKEI